MLGVLVGGVVASRSHHDAMARERFAQNIRADAFQLASLASDYLLFPDSRDRIERQWAGKWQSLEKTLSRPGFADAEKNSTLASLRRLHAKTRQWFLRVISMDDAARLEGGGNSAAGRSEKGDSGPDAFFYPAVGIRGFQPLRAK